MEDNNARALIKEAASELQEILPCVKFWVWPKGRAPLKYKETFIHVMKSGNGCSSHVGKKPSGSQKMKLDSKCMKLGTIIHEMIHALGFHHEQSRPDRDDYVEVNFDNIREGKQNNFKKYDYNEVSTFGVPYNPKSITQYSSKAFSANGEPTILTINGKRISNSKRLQKTDIIKLKRMYKC
ncbi:Protein SpAN [Orchesella cincta]|uniref:Metalloendopeptidase n=1 Tax=Orchesella cincta TaxID=48709 RepID=A0A1D2MCG0_ORCCI|nr:Protein SpAN [Orchesella cincta]